MLVEAVLMSIRLGFIFPLFTSLSNVVLGTLFLSTCEENFEVMLRFEAEL